MNVVTIMMAISTAATTRTFVAVDPNRRMSALLDLNAAEIGAPNNFALDALSNWDVVQPYRVCWWMDMPGLRCRSTWNRPMKTGICTTIGRQPISGLAPS